MFAEEINQYFTRNLVDVKQQVTDIVEKYFRMLFNEASANSDKPYSVISTEFVKKHDAHCRDSVYFDEKPYEIFKYFLNDISNCWYMCDYTDVNLMSDRILIEDIVYKGMVAAHCD